MGTSPDPRRGANLSRLIHEGPEVNVREAGEIVGHEALEEFGLLGRKFLQVSHSKH